MALSWRARRQLLYYTVGTTLVLVSLIFTYVFFLSETPTCFDGKQNGREGGVDCSGSCVRICASEAESPRVLWVRALRSSSHTYTLIAYLENPHPTAAARNVPYLLELRDEEGLFVLERAGTLDIPPVVKIPLIELNVEVGERSVSSAFLSFPEVPQWNKTQLEALQYLRTGPPMLNADATRLTTAVSNEGLRDIEDIAVVATLFDSGGVARAASRTFIYNLPRQSLQEVVFTWNEGNPDIVRAEIIAIPAF